MERKENPGDRKPQGSPSSPVHALLQNLVPRFQWPEGTGGRGNGKRVT